MSKVINRSGLECTIFGLGLLAIAGYNYSKGPDTDIPMSIGELVVDTYEDKDVVAFSELEGLNVYLDYSYSNDNLTYGSTILKEVDGDNYTAYYNYKSGDLYSVEFDELSLADRRYYSNYLDKNLYKISSLEEQLYNPNNIKFINDGIHYDEEYVDYNVLKLMDASMIPHNKDDFREGINYVSKEKKLTK